MRNKNQLKPHALILKANKKYLWCACGLSKNQPFCDGAHKKNNNSVVPISLLFEEPTYVKLCGCKKTNNPPYCDGSHLDEEL